MQNISNNAEKIKALLTEIKQLKEENARLKDQLSSCNSDGFYNQGKSLTQSMLQQSAAIEQFKNQVFFQELDGNEQ